MTQHELIELIRMVSAGRRDAADKLAEILFPLLEKPAEEPPKPAVTRRKVGA